MNILLYPCYLCILAECEVTDDCCKTESCEGEDVLCVDGSCRSYTFIEDVFCTDEMNKKSGRRNILSTLRKNKKA